MHYAIFTSYDERLDSAPRIGQYFPVRYKDSTNSISDRNLTKRFSARFQEVQAETWRALCPTSRVFCDRTIQDALDRVRGIAVENHKPQVLITGSLHLVSGAICLLETDEI